MKYLISVVLTILLVVTFVISGCTPTPAPAPAPSPTPTPAPAQVVKLKLAHHMPPVAINHKIYTEWSSKIKEQTNGRVEIDIFPAESLAKSQDMYNSLVGGICDIAAVLTPFARDQFPLSGILLQPFGAPSFIDGVNMWTELYNKFPAMKAEFAQVQLLFSWVSAPQILNFVKKQARVPADIKGMKLFSESASTLELFRLADATPVFSSITEAYMGLERGLAEGLTAPYPALRVFGLIESTKHHLEISVGAPQCLVIMNGRKWNSLPPDVQKIVMDLSQWASEAVCNANKAEVLDIKKQCEGLKHTFAVPTTEEYKLWSALFPQAVDKWIKDEEAKGRPAKALYEEASRLTEKYSK